MKSILGLKGKFYIPQSQEVIEVSGIGIEECGKVVAIVKGKGSIELNLFSECAVDVDYVDNLIVADIHRDEDEDDE